MTTDARTFPDGTIEWADRPAGEIPPGIVPRPTLMDQIAGQAHAGGLNVTTSDQWILCWCEDNQHAPSQWMQREVWGDGLPQIIPAWRHDRREVVTDYHTTHGNRHIVHRAARVITGPAKSEVA